MIRDEDLKSSVDYSEGQKRAAHRVLVELVNIFEEYEDEIRVVGGWVPDLMFPQEGHVGSVDVDIRRYSQRISFLNHGIIWHFSQRIEFHSVIIYVNVSFTSPYIHSFNQN